MQDPHNQKKEKKKKRETLHGLRVILLKKRMFFCAAHPRTFHVYVKEKVTSKSLHKNIATTELFQSFYKVSKKHCELLLS